MPLLYEKRGHVAVLTLSRPEARNAWCVEYNERFIELLPALEDDRDIQLRHADRRSGGQRVLAQVPI